jgi:hypothetical protein
LFDNSPIGYRFGSSTGTALGTNGNNADGYAVSSAFV